MYTSWVIPFLLLSPRLILALPALLGINGGAGYKSFDDDICHDYPVCVSKGRDYWTWLQGNITVREPTGFPGGKRIYDLFYASNHLYIDDTHAPSIRQDLLNHNLPALTDPTYTYWFTSSKDPTTGIETEDPAYKNIINTRYGVLLALHNFRDEDDAKMLPWSEIMYQVWQESKAYDDEKHAKMGMPPGASLATLQHSIQTTVTNERTLDLLELMYTKMGYPPIRDGDTVWRRWTERETRDWFLALLGTDNCKGTVFLLTQHADEAGRKEVTEIWTRWNGDYPDIWYVSFHLLYLYVAPEIFRRRDEQERDRDRDGANWLCRMIIQPARRVKVHQISR